MAKLLLNLSLKKSEYSNSTHYNGKKFLNINQKQIDKKFHEILRFFLTKRVPWPQWIDDNDVPQIASQVDPHGVVITHINHATHLIQLPAFNILTDPVFSQYLGPRWTHFLGPKRHRPVGVEMNQLPPIDLVIISHNHYDHLDVSSLKKLNSMFQPEFIVPLGDKKLLTSLGIKKVQEMDWWESAPLKGNESNGQIYFVPSQHWSSRGLFDRNKSLWGSYVIDNKHMRIYFAGDTGYGPHFNLIKEKWDSFDVTFIPIGAYKPRWFLKEQHLNPEEAVQVHLHLNSRFSLASHFGTFQLTAEGIDEPELDLSQALKEKNLAQEKFVVPKNGQTYFLINP